MLMKNLLTLAVFMFGFIGMNAEPVDFEKAKSIAASMMSKDVEPVLVNKAVRNAAKARNLSRKVQETSPYYIFSRGEGQGFVIVSGDDCLPEVLGYTEQGDYDEAALPPHFFSWLNYYKAAVEDAQEAGKNVSRKASARKGMVRRSKDWKNIPALLTTHWHQTSPYNDRCPYIPGKNSRAVTGCTATAAAQVIYYYRKDNPSVFLANTPTYDADEWHRIPVKDQIKKGTPIKWDLMLDSYNGTEPQEFKQAVADLCFAVGAMDKMDYGESSAAQITDLVNPLKTYFNLLSESLYKSDGSHSWIALEEWEEMIYNDLAEGHPIVYTGYHADQGGHAVVLDGYQASTGLFHFNFGWGGQGDGWYTVDDETGMNHFNMWQGMTYKIRPQRQNVKADIEVIGDAYENATNMVQVKVKNNSSLNLKGVYLFASTSTSKPSKLSNAKSSDEAFEVESGDEAELQLTFKPTSTRTWYLTVTDKKLNVLGTTEVTPKESVVDILLQDLAVAGSTATENFENESYQIVYNTKSKVYANLLNNSSVGYEETLRMMFYVYDEATEEWNEVGYKTGKLAVNGHETGMVTFNIIGTSSCPFETGKYYYGKLVNPIPNSDDVIKIEKVDSIVRFVLKDCDMEVLGFDDNCLALKGHFDVTAFNSTSFAEKNIYKSVTSFDLTQCVDIEKVEQEVNPNALIYVADNSLASGSNVIRAGKCSQLKLVPGYAFQPRAEFVAEKAELLVGEEVAKWYLLTSPFDAVVPDGIIAREIMSHTSSGISNQTRDVKMLEAGKTYLVMSSSLDNLILRGENVKVLAAPLKNTDEAVVGTYTNTVAVEGALLLNDDESQYFVPVEEGSAVEALRGYCLADDLTKSFRAYSNILLDPSFLVLAESINRAYGALAQYGNLVEAANSQAFIDKIRAAESEFSNRGEGSELTTGTKIKKYAGQLDEAVEEFLKSVSLAGGLKIDFTSCIVNPSFETKTTKGWIVGTKEGYAKVSSVNAGTLPNNNRAVGLDGEYVFQSVIASADSTSVGISQTVEGLIPGYYRLTAMLGTDVNSTVTMFAGDSSVTVSGHEFGSLYLSEASIDSIIVKANDGMPTGTLEIGVREGRWYKADDFVLTYLSSLPLDEDDANAIVDAVPERQSFVKGIFTLQGVRVEEMTEPGIYIVNGKKYIHRKL